MFYNRIFLLIIPYFLLKIWIFFELFVAFQREVIPQPVFCELMWLINSL